MAVAAVILGILDLFGLFGGGSAPPIPPAYYRLAHYILSWFIGCDPVTPNMQDSAKYENPIPGGWRVILVGESDQYTRELNTANLHHNSEMERPNFHLAPVLGWLAPFRYRQSSRSAHMQQGARAVISSPAFPRLEPWDISLL
ncbi:MAG: hypothetical protein IVW54_19705 [Candidatus Binataceae bacterium]|nr:hypothetical protein [Candidatus Binataceae bacterium]